MAIDSSPIPAGALYRTTPGAAAGAERQVRPQARPVEPSLDLITPAEALTLAGLFQARIRRSPQALAYRQFEAGVWRDSTWAEMGEQLARWQAALGAEGLAPGDRVAIMLHNCREWVLFDQAALGLGLVTVPLYVNDRAENTAYILEDAGARVLLLRDAGHWGALAPVRARLARLTRILSLEPVADARVTPVADWLPDAGAGLSLEVRDPHALATIVYTSGTTGRCKGVMLSHLNILWNAHAGLRSIPVYPADLLLSFLPLCHTLERTVGYYLPVMAGAAVAYARSIPQLGEDLLAVRPTILVAVPRIFERVYQKTEQQLAQGPVVARWLFRLAVAVGWRRFTHRQRRAGWTPLLLAWPLLRRLVADRLLARLGGRLRLAISGGAPLSPAIARTFIGMGLDLEQGYGLTETSPVVSVNRPHDNVPASVGLPLPEVALRIGAEDELLVRSPGVMLGYWGQPEATRQVVDASGWLRTGDKARLGRAGHIHITGRLKDIIVLATGEKVPPADLEMAITLDPLLEQVLVIGEGRPYLTALVVLSTEHQCAFAAKLGLHADDPEWLADPRPAQAVLARIAERLRDFPRPAQVQRVALLAESWAVDNGLLTPTLKLRREAIIERHRAEVDRLYEGH